MIEGFWMLWQEKKILNNLNADTTNRILNKTALKDILKCLIEMLTNEEKAR